MTESEKRHEKLKRLLGVTFMLQTMARDTYTDFIELAKEEHKLAGNKKYKGATNDTLMGLINAERHLRVSLDDKNSAENKKAFSDDYIELQKIIETFLEL